MFLCGEHLSNFRVFCCRQSFQQVTGELQRRTEQRKPVGESRLRRRRNFPSSSSASVSTPAVKKSTMNETRGSWSGAAEKICSGSMGSESGLETWTPTTPSYWDRDSNIGTTSSTVSGHFIFNPWYSKTFLTLFSFEMCQWFLHSDSPQSAWKDHNWRWIPRKALD